MRIIAGEARGRTLVAPKGSDTRPTQDYVRESLFNILRLDVAEACVLDLFAGSGALALEAVSRGASAAAMADCSAQAVACIRRNVEASGFGERCAVYKADWKDALAKMAAEGRSFNLVFLDPPYRMTGLETVCARMAELRLLQDGAKIVIEHRRGCAPAPDEWFALRDTRRYGDTEISFFTYQEGEKNMRNGLCVYPGSFDPVTLGHVDLIGRASKLFPEVVVAVLNNPEKKNAFTVEQRLSMLTRACRGLPNVRIDSFEGLLVDYMRNIGAEIVLRGLRAVTDFENEFQMAQVNRQIAPGIETLFLMTSPDYAYISSSAVRQIASFKGDISTLVPECILEDVYKAFQ